MSDALWAIVIVAGMWWISMGALVFLVWLINRNIP